MEKKKRNRITPAVLAGFLGAEPRDKKKDEYSNTLKDTYRSCFPRSILDLEISEVLQADGTYGKGTFEQKYINNDSFISPKGDRDSLTENDTRELKALMKLEELINLVDYLKTDRIELCKKIDAADDEIHKCLLDEGGLKDDDRTNNLSILEDYNRTNNPSIRLMILLMASLFQSRYESCIFRAISRYMDNHKEELFISISERSHEQYLSWNREMFLEKAGGKKLGEVYIVPKCLDKQNDSTRVFDAWLDSFLDSEKQKLLLILGGPGAGKSTLFTYLFNCEEINYSECKNSFSTEHYYKGKRLLLYRFNELNPYIDWNQDKSLIVKRILKLTGLKEPKENEDSLLHNSILLLDGFDECSAKSEKRKEVLGALADQLGSYCRIVVTSRYHYINRLSDDSWNIKVLHLKNFDREQIVSFITSYKGIDTKTAEKEYTSKMLDEEDESDEEDEFDLDDLFDKEDELEETNDDDQGKTDIYGIPIILYMVLYMWDDLKIESYTSIAEIYDQIFCIEGGIYDHMAHGERYQDGRSESQRPPIQGRPMTDEEFLAYKKHINRVSGEIAFFIFENQCYPNARKQEIEQLLKSKSISFPSGVPEKEQYKLNDLLKAGMFMKHVDAPERADGAISFVHKTMYEYFMAEYVYQMIVSSCVEGENKEAALCSLAEMLKTVLLTAEICDFLEEKLSKSETTFSAFEQNFSDMLNYGLSSYVNITKEKKSAAVFSEEKKRYAQSIFANLMYITQTFRMAKGIYKHGKQFQYLFQDNREIRESFPEYLRLGRYEGLQKTEKNEQTNSPFDLSGINFSEMTLANIDMKSYILKYSDLRRVNFCHSDLSFTNLIRSKLEGAAFTNAKLIGTTPSAKELFDTPEYGIPWTSFTGYYPEKYKNGSEHAEIQEGDIIKFGSYPQNSADSSRRDPIEWRILEIRGNKALLLADKILDQRRYHEEFADTNWKDCDIRRWLNSELPGKDGEMGGFLYEAFLSNGNRDAYSRICPALIEPHENIIAKYQSPQGDAVIDKVFLLSGEEVLRYFGGENAYEDDWKYRLGGDQAVAVTTAYAHSKGLASTGKLEWWWLRSVGASPSFATGVGLVGSVDANGFYVLYDAVGVRPALWINLKS